MRFGGLGGLGGVWGKVQIAAKPGLAAICGNVAAIGGLGGNLAVFLAAWRHWRHGGIVAAFWRHCGGTGGTVAAIWRHGGTWRHGGILAAILAALAAFWRHWRQSGGILAALAAFWWHWRHRGGASGTQCVNGQS